MTTEVLKPRMLPLDQTTRQLSAQQKPIHCAIKEEKCKNASDGKNASFPEALNNFYAWFEAQTCDPVRETTPCKAAGPDNIPDSMPGFQVLRGCADQLADVLTCSTSH